MTGHARATTLNEIHDLVFGIYFCAPDTVVHTQILRMLSMHSVKGDFAASRRNGLRLPSISFPANHLRRAAMQVLNRYRECLAPLRCFPGKGIILLLFILGQFLSGIRPVFLGNIVSGLADSGKRSLDVFLNLGLFATACLLALAFRSSFSSVVRSSVREFELSLRQDLWDKLQRMSTHARDRLAQGSIHNKILRDVVIVANSSQMLIQCILGGIVLTVFSLGIAFAQSPLGAAGLILILPAALAMALPFRKRLEEGNRQFRLKGDAAANLVGELLEMLPIFRSFAADQRYRPVLHQTLTDWRSSGKVLDRANTQFEILVSLYLEFVCFLVLIVGSGLCLMGRASVGEVITFHMLYAQSLGALNQMVGVLPHFQTTMESCRSLNEVLINEDTERDEGKTWLRRVRGDIRLDNVSFSYDESGPPILENVSLVIEPGQTVAVTGPNGSGKSTLTKLLIGCYFPTQGTIRFDGYDVTELDRRSLRRRIAVVPQHVRMHAGTIRENITLRDSSIVEPQLQEAIEIANLTPLIERLPQGLETLIGPQGIQLSGGEQQKVAIARAIVRNPDILIFDEITNHLDREARRKVLLGLCRFRRNRTTIVITHEFPIEYRPDQVFAIESRKCRDLLAASSQCI